MIHQLPEKIVRNGFEYTMLERTLFKALYEQFFQGRMIGYEVWLVNRKKSRDKYTHIEEFFEKFPSNEEFGINAWAFHEYEKAKNCYDQISHAAQKSQLELPFG